jgi:glucose/arabinose dehydrogenase
MIGRNVRCGASEKRWNRATECALATRIERNRARGAPIRHRCSVASAQDAGNGRLNFLSLKGGVMKTSASTDRIYPFHRITAAPPAGRSKLGAITAALVLAGIAWSPSLAFADVANAACPMESVFFDPGHGQDIIVPEGFKVEVFAKGLNSPTAIAFKGNKENFDVFVLESGHGLPSRCNDNVPQPPLNPNAFGGKFSPNNPQTPDILVFDDKGNKKAGPLGKPTLTGGGFQPDGPAVGLAFEHGFKGGRLFATDSNQSIRVAGQNNSSRIVTVDPMTGVVKTFITGLPTGDHPSEQIAFRGEWIYWSQGSATNSGVVGHDNGGGANQQEIPCQDITLSQNVFSSGADGHTTSGYSPHGVHRPGAVVKAFESATKKGMCTGAILRAKVNAAKPDETIEPVSWGYRNPFGLRFAPDDHALKGGLFVTENGEDERGARPTNNSPDRLQLAQQNPNGTPDYHGWPDRLGFLDSTQAVFNPVGGPGDDCVTCSKGKPVQHVLAFPPQPPVAPLGLEPADVAAVGLDFVPKSFVHGVVERGAALVSREGDFGFSAANGTPEAGHDVELVNFSRPGEPLQLELSRFAFNNTFEQAFVSKIRGINRPVDIKFGPDKCAYLVDYGAVRDFGQSSPESKFVGPANGPLVQIPGTGVIWKICGTADRDRDDDDADD